MEITELPPTPLVLTASGDVVSVRTQRWALERWDGEDPPGLATPWACKPKFSVNGSRSCAELAIAHHLRGDGWRGVWVNAFRGELRSEWFPAPAARMLAQAGAPGWAVEIFGRLRAANGGTLSGFFDVFAWREPGLVGFYEAKVGPDRIKPTQLRFMEVALRLHRLEDFLIVEVAGPFPRSASAGQPATAAGWDARRSLATQPDPGGRALLRRSGRDLLRALNAMSGPDEPQTRQMLGHISAAIEARQACTSQLRRRKAMPLQVCGHVISDPAPVWRRYAHAYPDTIAGYDLGDPGDPGMLTKTEAWRSRVALARVRRWSALVPDTLTSAAATSTWEGTRGWRQLGPRNGPRDLFDTFELTL